MGFHDISGEVLGGVFLIGLTYCFLVNQVHKYLKEKVEIFESIFESAEQNKNLGLASSLAINSYKELSEIKISKYFAFLDPCLYSGLKKDCEHIKKLSKQRLEELAKSD